MNQIEIGCYITKKRKEKNLTQAELAEKIGVSNKTVSKWETGKCLPDYAVIQPLCDELGISISELMDADDSEPDSFRSYDDEQILDLVRRMQNLESEKNSLRGVILILMGLVLLTLHYMIGGSDVMDFFSGVMLGLSIGVMLTGVYVAARGIFKQQK